MKTSLSGKRGQRGDTIVEVLISIAVASMVLASAYAITNRNVTTTQDTQEHNQALQIAQQQVEGLRALSAAGTDLTTAFPAGPHTNKCVTTSGLPAVSSSCQTAPGGGACANSACYQIEVTQPTAGIYEVKVTWGGLKGDTLSVSLDYGI